MNLSRVISILFCSCCILSLIFILAGVIITPGPAMADGSGGLLEPPQYVPPLGDDTTDADDTTAVNSTTPSGSSVIDLIVDLVTIVI